MKRKLSYIAQIAKKSNGKNKHVSLIYAYFTRTIYFCYDSFFALFPFNEDDIPEEYGAGEISNELFSRPPCRRCRITIELLD